MITIIVRNWDDVVISILLSLIKFCLNMPINFVKYDCVKNIQMYNFQHR